MPEGWEKVQLGELVTFAAGYSFPSQHQGNGSGAWPFYKVSDMNTPGNERGMFAAVNYVGPSEQSVLRFRLWPSGTVIFPKVGAALLTEKRRYLTSDSVFDNNIMGLTAGPRILSEYLFAVMTGIKLGEFAQHGAVPSINKTHVYGLEVLLPKLEEQRRIVDLIGAVDDAIKAADSSVTRAQQLYAELLTSFASQRSFNRELAEALKRVTNSVTLEADGEYRIVGLERSGQGFIDRGVIGGSEIGYAKLTAVGREQLVYRKLTAWEGPIFVSDQFIDGSFVSGEFPVFDVDSGLLLPGLLRHFCRWPGFWERMAALLTGSVLRRKRLNPEQLLRIQMPMPDSRVQREWEEVLDAGWDAIEAARNLGDSLRTVRTEMLSALLSGAHRIPETYDELMGA